MNIEDALKILKTLVEDCGDPRIDVEALKVIEQYIKDTQK